MRFLNKYLELENRWLLRKFAPEQSSNRDLLGATQMRPFEKQDDAIAAMRELATKYIDGRGNQYDKPHSRRQGCTGAFFSATAAAVGSNQILRLLLER
jgi:hypothetical protein